MSTQTTSETPTERSLFGLSTGNWVAIVVAVIAATSSLFAVNQADRAVEQQAKASEAAIDAEFVGLAIEILQAAPSEDSITDDAILRSWAVAVLSAKSPVAFEEELADALSSGRIVLCASLTTDLRATEALLTETRERIDKARTQLDAETTGTGGTGTAGNGPASAEIRNEINDIEAALSRAEDEFASINTERQIVC